MNIADIQNALLAKGYDPGPVDNVFGPLTRGAVIAFQTDRGLVPDGIVGPLTRAALFGLAAAASDPTKAIPTEYPWLHTGHGLLGVKATPGPATTAAISNWAHVLKIGYAGDHVNWCGLYMAYCMATSVPEAPIPANPLVARNWLNFGQQVQPQFGAILVFWRVQPNGWQGHVGFYWAEEGSHYHLLGGNQSNAVTITRIQKSRLLGARMPAGVTPLGITRTAKKSGQI